MKAGNLSNEMVPISLGERGRGGCSLMYSGCKSTSLTGSEGVLCVGGEGVEGGRGGGGRSPRWERVGRGGGEEECVLWEGVRRGGGEEECVLWEDVGRGGGDGEGALFEGGRGEGVEWEVISEEKSDGVWVNACPAGRLKEKIAVNSQHTALHNCTCTCICTRTYTCISFTIVHVHVSTSLLYMYIHVDLEQCPVVHRFVLCLFWNPWYIRVSWDSKKKKT